ncbi:MAG: hypothetical protein MI743_05115 [Sneathiellales bacterium]|nr:hypothetical protein [Sneathiellales bacterium]
MKTWPQDFDQYAFSKAPDYKESATREAFAALMPLKTIVIYCYDPRARGIPNAVAKALGETYPGEPVTDDAGDTIGVTTTMLDVVVAGGRAVDALRSITVGQHLMGVENIVVVHHTHCGATSYTKAGIEAAFESEHGHSIAGVYPDESVCISDFNSSLPHDVQLIREAPGTPPHVSVFGFLYDIDTHELIRVAEDIPADI